jgi:NADH:ubiquinone oxidoreductase subunit C
MDMQSKSAHFILQTSGLDTKNKKLKNKNFNVIYKLYKYDI